MKIYTKENEAWMAFLQPHHVPKNKWDLIINPKFSIKFIVFRNGQMSPYFHQFQENKWFSYRLL